MSIFLPALGDPSTDGALPALASARPPPLPRFLVPLPKVCSQPWLWLGKAVFRLLFPGKSQITDGRIRALDLDLVVIRDPSSILKE